MAKKIIAVIICVCFLWQDVVFAAGGDFLRQRQFYEQTDANANGAEKIIRDNIKNYFLKSRQILTQLVNKNPTIKPLVLSDTLKIMADMEEGVLDNALLVYNAGQQAVNIEDILLQVLDKKDKKKLLNMDPFYLVEYLTVNYFMASSETYHSRLGAIIDKLLNQNKRKFSLLVARGMCYIFSSEYKRAEGTLKEAYDIFKTGGLNDDEKKLLPTLCIYLADAMVSNSPGLVMPEESDRQLLWAVLCEFNPDKKNLYIDGPPWLVFTNAYYVFFSAGETEKAYMVIRKIRPLDNEMQDLMATHTYTISMMNGFMEYSYQNARKYILLWAEGEFNQWKSDADWLLRWSKTSEEYLNSGIGLDTDVAQELDALRLNLYNLLAVSISGYSYILFENLNELSQKTEQLSAENLILLSRFYDSIGCLDKAGEILLAAELKDRYNAFSDYIASARKSIREREAKENAGVKNFYELLKLYKEYEVLFKENKFEQAIEGINAYLAVKYPTRAYVPLWLILFKSLYKKQRFTEAQAILSNIKIFYPYDPELIELENELDDLLQQPHKKQETSQARIYPEAKEEIWRAEKHHRPKAALARMLHIEQPKKTETKLKSFDERWVEFKEAAVSEGINIDLIFNGQSGQEQLSYLIKGFLQLNLRWKGLQSKAVTRNQVGGHKPIKEDDLRAAASNILAPILFSDKKGLITKEGNRCLPTEKLIKLVQLIKEHFPEYDAHSNGPARNGISAQAAGAEGEYLSTLLKLLLHPVVVCTAISGLIIYIFHIAWQYRLYEEPKTINKTDENGSIVEPESGSTAPASGSRKNSVIGMIIAGLAQFNKPSALPASPPVLTPDRSPRPELQVIPPAAPRVDYSMDLRNGFDILISNLPFFIKTLNITLNDIHLIDAKVDSDKAFITLEVNKSAWLATIGIRPGVNYGKFMIERIEPQKSSPAENPAILFAGLPTGSRFSAVARDDAIAQAMGKAGQLELERLMTAADALEIYNEEVEYHMARVAEKQKVLIIEREKFDINETLIVIWKLGFDREKIDLSITIDDNLPDENVRTMVQNIKNDYDLVIARKQNGDYFVRFKGVAAEYTQLPAVKLKEIGRNELKENIQEWLCSL